MGTDESHLGTNKRKSLTWHEKNAGVKSIQVWDEGDLDEVFVS
jgi:hypothetical protein